MCRKGRDGRGKKKKNKNKVERDRRGKRRKKEKDDGYGLEFAPHFGLQFPPQSCGTINAEPDYHGSQSERLPIVS